MRPIQLVEIPKGTVMLHDARRQIRRTVELQPFEIGMYAVTEEQIFELFGVATSHPHRPAVEVTWLSALHACNAASQRAGLEPAYAFADHVTWDVTAGGYRLPTEAEWEFACRAGTDGPHYGPLEDVAWTIIDGVDAPQNVGGKSPNHHGLFDTLGNVWEWCWDRLDPARYGDYRVFRGGGFADEAWSVRASVHRGGAPDMHHPDVGFRFARGGFDSIDAAQGWSSQADRERARQSSALLSGWTPLTQTD